MVERLQEIADALNSLAHHGRGYLSRRDNVEIVLDVLNALAIGHTLGEEGIINCIDLEKKAAPSR